MTDNHNNEYSDMSPKNQVDNLHGGLIKIGPYEFEIPEYRFDLLYISNEEPINVNAGSFKLNLNITEEGVNAEIIPKQEPSTIFLQLEIEKPDNSETLDELGYFPNYGRMNENQRWVYLNWLRDIRKKIHISYVFTYYYGLERILMSEEFEKAFEEINFLRRFHSNDSFQRYSLHSLIQVAIKHNRTDLLHKIHYETNDDYVKDDILFLKYITGKDIDSDFFIKIIFSISGTNRRYIKRSFNLYQDILEENFNQEYGIPYFPFSNIFDVKGDKRLQLNGNANYSLDRNRKEYFKYPFFMRHKPFINEVLRIHEKTHEDVKKELTKRRKQ